MRILEGYINKLRSEFISDELSMKGDWARTRVTELVAIFLA